VIWYVENPRRNRHEREALEALASTVDWVTPIRWRIDDSLRLIWDADILVAGRTFPISLRYPSHFPHSPPLVLPRGATERWSSHQYGPGGELCLEHGADNWHPDVTGADMILSAHRLLQGERPAPDEGGTVASRHSTTLGQDLRGTFTRFMVTPALADYVSRVPDGAMLSARLLGIFHKEAFVYVLSSVVTLEGEKWEEHTLPSPLLFEGFEQPVALFRWSGDTALPPTDSLTKFRAAATERNLVLPAVKYALLVLTSGIRAYFLSEDDDTVSELSVIPPQPAVARLDQSHAMLAARKVGIVGCGSLGSKLAAMLARSGVGKFLLVDDDILFPENFVRHDLDWRDVATHKVDGVARRIQLVNPAATCERRKDKLGGQESSGSIESLIDGLATCDLIADTSADPSVFNYLCAAVAFAKKPLLWAEIFGGGFGGLIARHRPLLEPDPASMRRAIENWCSEQGKPIERAPIDYGGGPGVPLIADDADVTVIASHAARMAIDMLIPRNPSVFPNSVYMIGLAKGWIFERPFETYPIDVGPPIASDSQAALDPEEVAAEFTRIMQLFSEHKDAASSSASGNQTPSA
jgi:sulfur-carrier protein adenylyltransferase/sulfurtransferase